MPTIEVTEHEKMILYGLRGMLSEHNDEQLKIVEETYFAKSKQTLFTKAELADEWGCENQKVDRILKKAGVDPISKRGKEFEFDIDLAQKAKNQYDGEILHKHELNWKMRAM